MNAHAQLSQRLKALKLSGMLENLDLRLMEAATNQLSYEEFLSLVLQDELERRNMRKLARLIQSAGMGAEKTLETFDLSANPSLNAAYVRELATCRFIERGEGVFLVGPTGTGKTHLAKALCHQACRKAFTVSFYAFHAFLAEIHKADIKGTLPSLMKKLIKVDLLAIDDFAFKKIDQESAEHLYTIVDARYSAKSIIVTSNRAITDWAAVFPDPLMANAILDRLAHHSHHLVIKGESYRRKHRPQFTNA
jgi:DNA replication protein DnaC